MNTKLIAAAALMLGMSGALMYCVMQDIGGGVPGSRHSMWATDYFLK
jgi:hypothetical protein